MRGYRPSTPDPAGNYELAALARDCDAVHEALGGDERAVLIGHDWGAAVAYVALAASPHRWTRAVTMAVPPLGSMSAAFIGNYDQLQKSWYMFFFQNPLADFVVPANDLAFIDRLWADWSPNFSDPDHLATVKDALGSPEALTAALGYYRAMFAGGTRSAADDTLAPYVAASLAAPTQPVLYLHGADDGCIGIEVAETALAHLSSDSAMVSIPGAGHFVHLEAPENVHARIAAWLA
jgi:pimeloyl-ACP methyl ester carboxylesterase